jgi:hypothetical protein
MSPAKTLARTIAQKAAELKSLGFGHVVARISQGSERDRLIKYGSTRCGQSDKPLDLGVLPIPDKFKGLRHDEATIASRIERILADSEMENGTLAHKLTIYTDPFITFYREDQLELIAEEADAQGQQNQGAHWKLPANPFAALAAACSIKFSGDAVELTEFLRSPNPLEEKPVRHYFALTNLCNRACELCSCHSDPSRGTHLTFAGFERILSGPRPYEAQLEGGEPTIHKDFWKMVAYLQDDPKCTKVILCTNAVKVPCAGTTPEYAARNVELAKEWLKPFLGKPFLLKPSYNEHLHRHDKRLLAKLVALRQAFAELPFKPGSGFAINLRRRPAPLAPDGDQFLIDLLQESGLWDCTQNFEFQRYGRGAEVEELALPFVIPNPVEFYLHAPDGLNFGTDLIARANHMERMM